MTISIYCGALGNSDTQWNILKTLSKEWSVLPLKIEIKVKIIVRSLNSKTKFKKDYYPEWVILLIYNHLEIS